MQHMTPPQAGFFAGGTRPEDRCHSAYNNLLSTVDSRQALKEILMAIRIGTKAPDFTAETTAGKIKFHEWLGDSWGVLFSHPKDFTPVCTTELGYMAKLQPEFAKRNVKIIGLSVDPVGDHARWMKDIKE